MATPLSANAREVPAGYMTATTYESRGTPDRLNRLMRFVGSTDTTKDGFWIATGVSSSADWKRFDEYLGANLVDLSALSLVSGDILYYDGSNLNKLAKGTDGQVLTLASGLPSWAAAAGGGGGIPAMWVSGLTGTSLTSTESDVDWNLGHITDSNFWTAGDSKKFLLNDPTKDYILEAWFGCYNSSVGVSDDTLAIVVKRYNSSNVLQSTVISRSYQVPLSFEDRIISIPVRPARVPSADISSGDYLMVRCSNLGNDCLFENLDSWAKLYELDAV